MVFRDTIKLHSVAGRPTFFKITKEVQDIVDKSGIKNGICVVYSSHTTCSVITQEFSHDITFAGLEFGHQDFIDGLAKIFPDCKKEGQYMHPGPKLVEYAASINETPKECLNIDGHLRSALTGRSVTFGIVDGKMDMGNFGQIYFIDFDQVRERDRVAAVQLVGE